MPMPTTLHAPLPMTATPLETLRDAHALLVGWLNATRKLADPSVQPAGTVAAISEQVARVNKALREATPELAASSDWRSETAAYARTLVELRAQLQHFELAVRIRRNQAAHVNARIVAARYWSELAQHIG